VPRDLEELLADHVRRVDEVVAVAQDQLALVGLDLVADHTAARVPEDEPRAHALVHAEQVQRLAQVPVVAALGLLELGEVALQLLAGPEGGAVDALQHLALLVAAPIGAGGGEQLVVLQPARVRHVRATAEVDERPVGVRRDHLVRAQVVDALQLERVVGEALLGLGAVHLLAHEGELLGDHLAHRRLEGGEVVGRERRRDLEVVVEPVLDGRAEADPGVGPDAAHGRGQDVGGRVPEHLEAAGVLAREHDEVATAAQGRHEVLHHAVDRHGHRVARQAGADGLDHGPRQRALGHLAGVAVGQRQDQGGAHGRTAPERRATETADGRDAGVCGAMNTKGWDDDGAPSALPAEARRDTLQTYPASLFPATGSPRVPTPPRLR
jgi:hypothetical protein